MYFSKHKHMISNTILGITLVGFLLSGLMAVLRIIMTKSNAVTPDMLDHMISQMQNGFTFLQLLITGIIFLYAWKKIRKYATVVNPEEQWEMARLQEEFLGENKSVLSIDVIYKILQIWVVILFWVQIIYEITSLIYERFIAELLAALSGSEAIFVSIYNSTHGFKYIGMLIAILLGVMVTGIFLDDRILKIAAFLVAFVFLISFSVLQMSTVHIIGKSIGIVWTSVIFHFTKTVGLIVYALYLRYRYHGI